MIKKLNLIYSIGKSLFLHTICVRAGVRAGVRAAGTQENIQNMLEI